jgi:hypothetical protein
MPTPLQPDTIVDAPFELQLPDTKTGGASVLMIGSTRCGKTTALKYILKKYFKEHIGVVFSESARSPAYADMKNKNLPLSSAWVPELIKDMYKINKEVKNHYDFMVILDDMPSVKFDKELLKLTTIYRNSNLSSICCVQSPSLLTPTQRSNFNFVLLFKSNTTAQTEANIKAYLRGVFPETANYEMKIRAMTQMLEDHHFIFLDNLNGTIQRCKIDLGK